MGIKTRILLPWFFLLRVGSDPYLLVVHGNAQQTCDGTGQELLDRTGSLGTADQTLESIHSPIQYKGYCVQWALSTGVHTLLCTIASTSKNHKLAMAIDMYLLGKMLGVVLEWGSVHLGQGQQVDHRLTGVCPNLKPAQTNQIIILKKLYKSTTDGTHAISDVDPDPVGFAFIWVRGSGSQRYKMKGKAPFWV